MQCSFMIFWISAMSAGGGSTACVDALAVGLGVAALVEFCAGASQASVTSRMAMPAPSKPQARLPEKVAPLPGSGVKAPVRAKVKACAFKLAARAGFLEVKIARGDVPARQIFVVALFHPGKKAALSKMIALNVVAFGLGASAAKGRDEPVPAGPGASGLPGCGRGHGAFA